MLHWHQKVIGMELRQIEYVVAVARHGHVTRAAEELRVAQSALSRQIQQVERELGVRLFDRSRRRLQLTAAGTAFVARAERLLADLHGLREEMQEFAGLGRGRVAIGVLPSVAEARLPALVAAYHARYPGIEIVLRDENTMALMALLDSGGLDLAVVQSIADLYPSGRTPPGISVEPLFTEELVLITAPNHPMAAGDQLPLLALRAEPFIALKPGSGVRHTLLRACAAAGFAPRIAFECGEVSSVRALVAAGLGVAVAPRSAAEVAGPAVAVVVLDAPLLTRTVSLVWREDRYLPAAAHAFLAAAREHFSHDGAPAPPPTM